MSDDKTITCIVCPRGCRLSLAVDGALVAVSGHECGRGEEYGRQEAIEPMRSLTTTVRTGNPDRPRLPVRTDGELPLRRLLDAMTVLDGILVESALRRGDVIVPDLLGLGVNVVSSDDFPGKQGGASV